MAVDTDEDMVIRMINSASALRSATLDLSGKRIYEIPTEILNLKDLESIYLQSNYITDLPDGFFENLPKLKWLDLRSNRVTTLPRSIGKHRCLRSLLLEGNSLMNLPCELGMIKSLCDLSLSGNPLEFPPSDVVVKGTQAVLRYLREMCDGSVWSNDEKFPPSPVQSDQEAEEFFASKDLWNTSHPNADYSQSLDNERAKGSSFFKLPPIIRKATIVRRSHSEREVVQGQSLKKFEPTRRSTWETIMTSFNDVPLPWKCRDKLCEKSKEVKSEDEASCLDEKPAESSKKVKKCRKKVRKIDNKVKMKVNQVLLQNQDESCRENIPDEEQLKDKNMKARDEKKRSTTHPVLGDFVAIKVHEKHVIRGQPCVAKVVAEMDENDDILVHYYTGSYGGTFRAMMSRSSPYLRKVSLQNILCIFELKEDGRLSPNTATKLRQMIEP